MPLVRQGEPGAEELLRRDPLFGMYEASRLQRLARFSTSIITPAVAWEVNGVDTSKWNGLMDWEITESRGVVFAFIRAGFGNQTVDGQLENSMRNIVDTSIDPGLYWFAYVGSSDWRTSANSFKQVYQAYPTSLPPCGDFETTTLGRVETAQWIRNFMMEFEQLAGVPMLFYTSKGWWDGKVGLTSWAHLQKLFTASWTTGSAPYIPSDWSGKGASWTFWQHSADGNGLGVFYGAPPPPDADRDMDLDRYKGSLATYHLEFPGTVPPEPPEEEPVISPYFQKIETTLPAGGVAFIETKPVEVDTNVALQFFSVYSNRPAKFTVSVIIGAEVVGLASTALLDEWKEVSLGELTLFPGYKIRVNFSEVPAGAALAIRYGGELYSKAQ